MERTGELTSDFSSTITFDIKSTKDLNDAIDMLTKDYNIFFEHFEKNEDYNYEQIFTITVERHIKGCRKDFKESEE